MNEVRKYFPLLKKKINNTSLIYFDNAATSQKPSSVIEAVKQFYEHTNANVHRSLNPLGEEATRMYEEARANVARFINAPDVREVVFTKNTTESINLIARSSAGVFLDRGDVVVLTIAEHHSNIVPWLQLKDSLGIRIRFIPVQRDGSINFSAVQETLSHSAVKLFGFVHASNTLGTIQPAEDLIALAKKNNILVLVDAAQSVAHLPVDVQKMGCDFLTFSGHKMFGPTGIGVLWARGEILDSLSPFLGGGEMISEVFQDHFTVKEPPYKFEAGTPPIAQAVGLAAAIDFLNSLGWEVIQRRERQLAHSLYSGLSKLSFVDIFGGPHPEHRLPLASFILHGVHPHDIADMLGERGICIRAGHHCTMPLHEAFGVKASARASLAFYNTEEEIAVFLEALQRAYKTFV